MSWGVPWARGAVKNGQAFSLAGADGKALPLQQWALAYWPDGSLKWSGFATVAGPGNSGELRLTPGQRCGDHDVRRYLGQVNALKRQFATQTSQ